MTTTSSLNSKKNHVRSSLSLDILGSEVEEFDLGTNALFKVALYSGVKSGSSEVDEIFFDILKRSLLKNNQFSFQRMLTLLSFHHFKKRFVPVAIEDVKKLRVNWLLNECDVTDLSGLDSKGAQHHFNTLEQKIFEDYIQGWKGLSNWLEIEFQKVRKKYLLSLVKKYSHFFLFWCLIFLAIFVALRFTSQDSSLSIWDQMNGWINFVFQRLR